MLLVTGPVTRNMEIPLRRTYEAVPSPKFVVAVGDCAKTCGVFKDSYAVLGPVDRVIPVDISIAGCPPEPTDILRGILQGLDRFSAKRENGASKSRTSGGGSLMPFENVALLVMVVGYVGGAWSCHCSRHRSVWRAC